MTSPSMESAERSDITVVGRKPVLLSRLKVALFVAAVLVVLFLLGDLVNLVLGVAGGVFAVTQVSIVNRALTRLAGPLRRRRAANPRQPANVADRIEVRADQITALGPLGEVAGLRRSGDGVLTVSDHHGEPHLHVAGVDTASIGLRGFDPEAVGHAALERGWAWRSPRTGAVVRPYGDEPGVGVEIALRDGVLGAGTATKAFLVPVVVLGLAAFATIVAAFYADLTTAVTISVAAGGFGLAVLGIMGATFAVRRLSPLTVTIDRDRLAVRYGAMPAETVTRWSVARGTAGRRWVRLRDEYGKARALVPLRPKRREVLTALWSYGWPVTDDKGPG
ncbi:MAG: hypothetical protein GEV10_13400 [Streptosporangiales bacterium]|nr:hypothetical protein [Streptosporangiales bacterium]